MWGSLQKIIFILLTGIFLSSNSQARVFSFDNESFAPYFAIQGGLPSTNHQPYSWQSTSSLIGDRFDFIYGGEFGVYFRTQSVGLRLGALMQKFDPVQGATGLNSLGDPLFSVESSGLSYGPIVQLDYQFAKTPHYHWMFLVGGGLQYAKMENSYNFTSDGQSLVNGQTAINESYKAQYSFATIGIGTEVLLVKNTTVSFILGYNHMFEPDWKYATTGSSFAGPHTDAQPLLLEDGTPKKINWSHIFLQLSFQFYTQTLR